MPDEATNTDPAGTLDDPRNTSVQSSQTETPEADPPGAEALGDPGKKALDAMKAERNQYRQDLSALRSEFDAFKAKAEGKEKEHQAALEAQKVRDEALAAANERIKKAEIRAAAAGKLADPQDALRFLDLSEFEVDSDGNVNADLAGTIEDLIKSKPYLAAQGKRFEGGVDAGVRNVPAPKSLDDQIAEAEQAGDWTGAQRLKAKKLAELNK